MPASVYKSVYKSRLLPASPSLTSRGLLCFCPSADLESFRETHVSLVLVPYCIYKCSTVALIAQNTAWLALDSLIHFELLVSSRPHPFSLVRALIDVFSKYTT